MSEDVLSNAEQSSKKLTHDEIEQFVIDRFEEIKQKPLMKNLVHFHTINKFLIMAHSPKELNILGNLVANHDQKNIKDLLDRYEKHLRMVLKKMPTIGSNSNVIGHIFGHFSNELNADEKSSFLISLKHYREGKITLSEILSLLKSWTSKFDKAYLTRQTYFLLYFESPNQSVFYQN